MLPKYHAYCFTINNYTHEDLMSILNAYFRYCCFGFEVGPENGVPHIQGYIYFWSQTSLRSASKKLPRASLFVCNGSPESNIKYTSKKKDWYEFGDRPEQGMAKWDLIVASQQDPTSNPHLYQQYNKMYRSLTLSTKKDHERAYHIITPYSLPLILKMHPDIYDQPDISTYDGQEVMLIDLSEDTTPYFDVPFNIMRWYNGRPVSIRRGYEIICVDPRLLYICLTREQEVKFRKKYPLDIE